MLLEGINLSALISSAVSKDPGLVPELAESVLQHMIDSLIVEECFSTHRLIKTGAWSCTRLAGCPVYPPMPIAGHVDVFGLPVTTLTGLPCLKNVPQINCPNCDRTLAASRFAPHLEKCMGMGRNSSRVASRRLAAGNKESYREGVHQEEEDDDDDEWVEPGKKDKPRKRDKNSPRRHKNYLKVKGESGEGGGGTVTPPLPQSFSELCLDERRQLLSSICGVTLSSIERERQGQGQKICTRSLKCGQHSDTQRRELRARWLTGHKLDDDESDDDTTLLRESLSQLSQASSPADSYVSNSSRGEKGGKSRPDKGSNKRQGKKVKGSSKTSSSRGSTPPLMD